MAKAAPLPVLRFRTQSALDRIAMEVAQLLKELFIIAYLAILGARLPEGLGIADQPARDARLQRFHRIGERRPLRLAEEQRNVLRHDHVTVDEPPEATPNPLQCKFEDALGQGRGQERLAMVTAEGHQVSLPGLLEPL